MRRSQEAGRETLPILDGLGGPTPHCCCVELAQPYELDGGQGGNRTCDTRIFSPAHRRPPRSQAQDPAEFTGTGRPPLLPTEPMPTSAHGLAPAADDRPTRSTSYRVATELQPTRLAQFELATAEAQFRDIGSAKVSRLHGVRLFAGASLHSLCHCTWSQQCGTGRHFRNSGSI